MQMRLLSDMKDVLHLFPVQKTIDGWLALTIALLRIAVLVKLMKGRR
jgi:hypothetical protein